MPVKQITFLKPYSAQASMASRVALMHLVAVLRVVEPLDERRVGAHVDLPMAQVSPASLSSGKYFGATSSMLAQPSCLATLIICGIVPVRLEAPVDDRLLDPAVLDGGALLQRSRARASPARPAAPSTAAAAVPASKTPPVGSTTASRSSLVSPHGWLLVIPSLALDGTATPEQHDTPAAGRLRVPCNERAEPSDPPQAWSSRMHPAVPSRGVKVAGNATTTRSEEAPEGKGLAPTKAREIGSVRRSAVEAIGAAP